MESEHCINGQAFNTVVTSFPVFLVHKMTFPMGCDRFARKQAEQSPNQPAISLGQKEISFCSEQMRSSQMEIRFQPPRRVPGMDVVLNDFGLKHLTRFGRSAQEVTVRSHESSRVYHGRATHLIVAFRKTSYADALRCPCVVGRFSFPCLCLCSFAVLLSLSLKWTFAPMIQCPHLLSLCPRPCPHHLPTLSLPILPQHLVCARLTTTVHSLNSASESVPMNMTTQWSRNVSPALKEAFSRTTTRTRRVLLESRASMDANFDPISNEIKDSELQNEERDEQRI
jgi:hypothetical protein